VYLRAQAAAEPSDRLVLAGAVHTSFFLGAGAVLVGANDRAVDYCVLVVGIRGQVPEYPLSYA